MKRKLSTPAPRSELIASHAYGTTDALAVPPPPPAKPAPTDEKPPEKPAADAPTDADAAVSDALAQVKAALDTAIKAQKADDDDADPKDQKVTADLDALSKAVDQAIADQTADAANESSDDAPPPKPAAKPEKPAVTAAAPPPAPEGPETTPVDGDGNVDPKAVCANPDCQHLASAHLNDDAGGQNTGACQMTNCECLAFQAESQPNSGGDDQPATPPAEPAAKEDLAVADAPVSPAPPAEKPEPETPLNEPPMVEGGENMGPAFTIPVAIIEGQPTGDGRQIAPEALTWRTPPLPLMGLATETHDPNGMDMNDPAVWCGRIDGFAREPGENGTQIITAKGFYLSNDDGAYWADLNEQMGRLGVSADVAVNEVDMEVTDTDPDGFPIGMAETLMSGTIMGLTVCPYPAFEGAYIVLGDGEEQPDAKPIPQTPESPTVPDKPPAAVTAGGQLVHLMSYESCEPCDQGIELIVASGAGPVRPPASWFENPAFTVGDERLVEILDRRGNRVIGGKYACPLTVTDDGRVFGHIAPWGVCHTGTAGQCILAPKSKVDYAHFKRGQYIVTAEGEKVRVGVITAETGHAPMHQTTASQAMAHYDNTALVAADVNAGEDEFGIWMAGAIRPDATEEQIRSLTAASISGDWRKLGGTLELVAALAVNQPGFPLAVVASGQHEALVAAGAGVMDRLKHPAVSEVEGGDVVLRKALAPLLGDAKDRARLSIDRQSATHRLKALK